MLKRAKSLTEQAADEIRARIVRGDFQLGAPLSENTLATELGVSKTPIREALLRLKMEGLVSIKPQRGSFVFDMAAAEIVELGELRETLEVAALTLAARRNRSKLVADLEAVVAAMKAALDAGQFARYRTLDSDFHTAFFHHCGNSFFVSCYNGFAFRVQALRARLANDPALNRKSLGEHIEMVELLAEERAAEACTLLSRHVQGTIADYVSSLGRPPPERAATLRLSGSTGLAGST
ncbi:MAG: GntR family transcriptional regulator [Geminicoccales bacterium]